MPQHITSNLRILLLLLFVFAFIGEQQADTYQIDYHVSEDFSANMLPVDSLIRIGQELLYADPEQSKQAAEAALKQANIEQEARWEIRASNLLGSIYEVQSRHDSALYNFFHAHHIAAQLEDNEQLGNSCNNIGVTYWRIGNYKDALIYFFQALDYYDLGGYEGSKANTLNNIGLIYGDLDNYEKAHDYYWQAFDVYHELNDSIKMGAALTNIGTAHLNLEQPDSALHFLYESLEIKEATNDLYGQCISLEGIGNAWLSLASYDQASAYFSKGTAIAKDIGFENGKASSLLGMAKVQFKQGDAEAAFDLANDALQIAGQTSNMKMQYLAHQIISDIYEANGYPTQALKHYRLYNEIKSESINKNRLHQVYNLEIQHAAEKNLRELEKQELLLSRKNTMLIFVSVSFTAALIIIFLLYRLHLNKIRQKERNQKAASRLKMTEERTRAALEAEINERKRLGFELHDGVGPLLSLAKMNIAALLKKENLHADKRKSMLENTRGTILEVLKEMRQISNNMAPLILLEKGLEAAIKDLVAKMDTSSQYRISLDITGLHEDMEPYIKHAIYRSLQEVLNNVIRHAQGTEIHIQLIQNKEDLTVMVEDDGKGFNPGIIDQKKGIGLKSAISRIQGLKGEFLIDSAEGRGTIITIIVPFVKQLQIA